MWAKPVFWSLTTSYGAVITIRKSDDDYLVGSTFTNREKTYGALAAAQDGVRELDEIGKRLFDATDDLEEWLPTKPVNPMAAIKHPTVSQMQDSFLRQTLSDIAVSESKEGKK